MFRIQQFDCRDLGLISGWGTKIVQAVLCCQEEKKCIKKKTKNTPRETGGMRRITFK